jgi:hypothetical protein
VAGQMRRGGAEGGGGAPPCAASPRMEPFGDGRGGKLEDARERTGAGSGPRRALVRALISSSGGCPRALDFVQRRLAVRWRRKAATERWWRLAALALDFVRASSGGGREQKRRAGGGRQQSSGGGGGWTACALYFFLGIPGVEMLSVSSIVGCLAEPSCTPSVDSRRRALVRHAPSPLQPPGIHSLLLGFNLTGQPTRSIGAATRLIGAATRTIF